MIKVEWLVSSSLVYHVAVVEGRDTIFELCYMLQQTEYVKQFRLEGLLPPDYGWSSEFMTKWVRNFDYSSLKNKHY